MRAGAIICAGWVAAACGFAAAPAAAQDAPAVAFDTLAPLQNPVVAPDPQAETPLTPQEADELVTIVRNLTKQGKSIIFISHKLREVLAIADRVEVLRLGKIVGKVEDLSTATEASLAALMVGRTVVLRVNKGEAHPGDTVLTVNNLKALDDRGVMSLNGATFQVRAVRQSGAAVTSGSAEVTTENQIDPLLLEEGLVAQNEMVFAGDAEQKVL